MNKRLLRALVRKVREFNITVEYPFRPGDKLGHYCHLCRGSWKNFQREAHKPKCMLAQGYRELGVQPPVSRK